MSFQFGGKPCYDAGALLTACLELHYPIDLWYGKANSFACPLGCEPGFGWLLMLLNDLKTFNIGGGTDKLRTLSMIDPITGDVQAFPGIVMTGHLFAATPGAKDDLATLYVVQIADERWLYWRRGMIVDQAYNLLDDADGSYVNSTTNSGTPWTWQQIVTNLWPSALGTEPNLPWTPDGTPNGFWYHDVSQFEALQHFLTRLACALYYNAQLRTWTIVRLGANDDGVANQFTTKYAPLRRYDVYEYTTRTAALPANIRVNFKVMPPPTDGSSPYYSIDTPSTPAGGLGSLVLLEDDLTAIGTAPGVYSNSAALTSRAAERVSDWLRKRNNFDTGEIQVYAGILPAQNFIGTTGAGVWAAAWKELGGDTGAQTEFAAGSLDNLPLQIERDARGGWIRTEYVASVTNVCPLESSTVVTGVSGFGLQQSGNTINMDPADDAGAILYSARTFV